MREASTVKVGVVRLTINAKETGTGYAASANMVSKNMNYIVTGEDKYYTNNPYNIRYKVR